MTINASYFHSKILLLLLLLLLLLIIILITRHLIRHVDELGGLSLNSMI